LGTINIFQDDCVEKILEVLDKHFKEDDLAIKNIYIGVEYICKPQTKQRSGH